jgi:hypothetical protein
MKPKFTMSAAGRVTRLGEFSPLGRLLLWAVFFENRRVSIHFFATVFHGKSFVLIFDKKMVWARIWAILSQTYLVTLFAGDSN